MSDNPNVHPYAPDDSPQSNDKSDTTEETTSSLNKELAMINKIQKRNTNFVFIFGGSGRGKTVVSSSILNYLSREQANGDLRPIGSSADKPNGGHALLRVLRRTFSQQRFPDRTVLLNGEPIYIDICFTPKNRRDSIPLNLTFLEMPGDVLKRVDVPSGARGELPESINVYLKAKPKNIAFILLTEPNFAADDDQLMTSFIEYIQEENREFEQSKFLLLISKWDTYDEGQNVIEFARTNMPLTYGKINSNNHSISNFTIGEVKFADESAYIAEYQPETTIKVIDWIWKEFTGKPLQQKSLLKRMTDTLSRYV